MKRILLTTLALLSAAAIAAPQPTSGAFRDVTGPLSFVGGPFTAPNLTSDRVYLGDSEGQLVLVCKKQAMNCDRFALTVDLTERFRDKATRQKRALRFSFNVQERQPLALVKPEFHLYVLDTNGAELGHSDFDITDDSLTGHLDLELKAVPNGSYTVVVTGYNGLGASYSAEIGLNPR